MRTLHVIRPRRTPSRRCFANNMRADYVRGLVIPRGGEYNIAFGDEPSGLRPCSSTRATQGGRETVVLSGKPTKKKGDDLSNRRPCTCRSAKAFALLRNADF